MLEIQKAEQRQGSFIKHIRDMQETKLEALQVNQDKMTTEFQDNLEHIVTKLNNMDDIDKIKRMNAAREVQMQQQFEGALKDFKLENEYWQKNLMKDELHIGGFIGDDCRFKTLSEYIRHLREQVEQVENKLKLDIEKIEFVNDKMNKIQQDIKIEMNVERNTVNELIDLKFQSVEQNGKQLESKLEMDGVMLKEVLDSLQIDLSKMKNNDKLQQIEEDMEQWKEEQLKLDDKIKEKVLEIQQNENEKQAKIDSVHSTIQVL